MVEKIKGIWCHKILPLVYDDSLSYYEVLCKLKAKVNEIITEINGGITPALIERINQIYADISYDSETKTLIFRLEDYNE